MRAMLTRIGAAAVLCGAPVAVDAHFLELMPSAPSVQTEDPATLSVAIAFGRSWLDMAPPRAVTLHGPEGPSDLSESLEPVTGAPTRSYTVDLVIDRPGDYTLVVEPEPYWEPAEDSYLVHLTKIVINAYGVEGDWDRPLGLATEIVPLTRPYGLWEGNLFTGQVLVDGQPAGDALVEITYANEEHRLTAPDESFVIQTVRADGDGVFSYAMPVAGWWGFAALGEGPERLAGPDGQPKAVELGALIWVNAASLP